MRVEETPSDIQTWLHEPGYYLGASQFTFSIPNASSVWPGYGAGEETDVPGFRLPDTATADAFRDAIGLWDDLIAPDFVEVTDDANGYGELRIAYTDMDPGYAAYAYLGPPQSPGGKVGDVWFNTNNTSPDWTPGSGDFATMIHEVGHTLGLKHTFEAPAVPAQYDNDRYSVMSYTGVNETLIWFGEEDGSFYAFWSSGEVQPATPMVFDIAAVQEIYGADPDTRIGDDTYTFTERDPSLQSIYDAGGEDTIDLSGFTLPNIIDLEPGGYSSIGLADAQAQIDYWVAIYPQYASFIASQVNARTNLYQFSDNLGIALSTVIENAIGGSGDDSITGNSADNELYGQAGDDLLFGGPGNDLLDGGADTDTADYSDAPGGVKVRFIKMGSPQDTLSAGMDTLVSIENVTGSAFDDVLRGDGNVNVIEGGEGMDELRGGPSDDTLVGGPGDDTILGGGGSDTGFGGDDSDTIRTEIAWGEGGNDLIRIAVEAHGGDGDDDLRATVNGAAQLFGDGDNDSLLGGTKNDTLDGGNGDDFLRGGEGKDTHTGGAGADIFRFNEGEVFSNTTNTDNITDFNEAEGDKINLVSIDAIVGGEDDPFAFIDDAAFSNTAGELRWEQDATDTYLMGDTTGDGIENFMIKLDGLVSISSAGIVL